MCELLSRSKVFLVFSVILNNLQLHFVFNRIYIVVLRVFCVRRVITAVSVKLYRHTVSSLFIACTLPYYQQCRGT